MTNSIIALAIGAIFGFASAYQIQQHRIDTKEAENAEQVRANDQRTAADNLRRQAQVTASQDAATARLGRLRSDAGASSAELARLRRLALYTSADADTSNSPAPSAERANTTSELFLECGGALQGLAAKADRHASDVEALMGAWPR